MKPLMSALFLLGAVFFAKANTTTASTEVEAVRATAELTEPSQQCERVWVCVATGAGFSTRQACRASCPTLACDLITFGC